MGYEHRQHGPWHIVLLVPSLGAFCLAWLTHARGGGLLVLLAIGLVLLYVAFSIKYLLVRDEGEQLLISYGPLPILRRRIRYWRMIGVEACRSSFFDGWGVHWTPGRGWIFNLWGFDCVKVQLTGGKAIRIGTDDPKGLAQFLRQKIMERQNP